MVAIRDGFVVGLASPSGFLTPFSRFFFVEFRISFLFLIARLFFLSRWASSLARCCWCSCFCSPSHALHTLVLENSGGGRRLTAGGGMADMLKKRILRCISFIKFAQRYLPDRIEFMDVFINRRRRTDHAFHLPDPRTRRLRNLAMAMATAALTAPDLDLDPESRRE